MSTCCTRCLRAVLLMIQKFGEQSGAPGIVGILSLHLHPEKFNMDTQTYHISMDLPFPNRHFYTTILQYLYVQFRVQLVFYIHFVISRVSEPSRAWGLLGGPSQLVQRNDKVITRPSLQTPQWRRRIQYVISLSSLMVLPTLNAHATRPKNF